MIVFTKTVENDPPSGNLTTLLAVSVIIMAAGISFGLHAMVVGHDHVFGTSREVPWGILITPYVFFACLSTGICIISSLGQIFRVKPLIPLVNRSVFLAIITMMTGLAAIGLEIENPWRMAIYGVLSPNPISNIWWKSSIYTLYLLFMIFNFLFLITNRTRIARILAICGLVTVTCGNLNMNSDMALLGARGFWAENYMPLFFLSMSTLTACAAIILFTWLSTRLHGRILDDDTANAITTLSRLMFVLLVGVAAYASMKVLGGFSTAFTDNPEAMQLLVRGDFAVNFWLGEIALTIVVPLVLIVLAKGGKNGKLAALAGVSCLIGAFVTYYDLIVVGQLIPHYHQYELVGMPDFYSYSPSLHEYMMTLGSLFIFLSTYFLGEIFYNSGAKPQ